jgi:hypothetical protein
MFKELGRLAAIASRCESLAELTKVVYAARRPYLLAIRECFERYAAGLLKITGYQMCVSQDHSDEKVTTDKNAIDCHQAAACVLSGIGGSPEVT